MHVQEWKGEGGGAAAAAPPPPEAFWLSTAELYAVSSTLIDPLRTALLFLRLEFSHDYT